MRLTILSTTLREEPFLPCMETFRWRAQARGHQCHLVRHGELGVALADSGEEILWGDGAVDLMAADLVVPRLSLRRLTRGDFYVLELLERRGVSCLNPLAAIEAARNKITTLQRLHQSGIDVPRTAVVRQPDFLPDAVQFLGPPPWVVKPSMGSQGRGVSRVDDLDGLETEFELRWAEDRHEILMVQEFLRSRGGVSWDVRLVTLLGRVLGAMRRDAAPGDFRANYSLGGTVSPFPVDEDLAALALRASAVLELDMAGVDVLLTERGPVVLEVNANPGWEGISASMAEAGYNFHDAFLEVLEQHFE